MLIAFWFYFFFVFEICFNFSLAVELSTTTVNLKSCFVFDFVVNWSFFALTKPNSLYVCTCVSVYVYERCAHTNRRGYWISRQFQRFMCMDDNWLVVVVVRHIRVCMYSAPSARSIELFVQFFVCSFRFSSLLSYLSLWHWTTANGNWSVCERGRAHRYTMYYTRYTFNNEQKINHKVTLIYVQTTRSICKMFFFSVFCLECNVYNKSRHAHSRNTEYRCFSLLIFLRMNQIRQNNEWMAGRQCFGRNGK